MKGNSDKQPEIVVKSNDKIQIRFNILEILKESYLGESQLSYDFDYIEIDGELTRGKIIDGIISNTYNKSAEIAMINNEIMCPGTNEYTEYQLLRTKAKEIASEVMKLTE